ncbi:MAG: molecular chaperone DnaJ, partial [Roseiflexaceae bacterium]|nr:molecular chaperone DnaJ [Roseiflexaceae bacterium]
RVKSFDARPTRTTGRAAPPANDSRPLLLTTIALLAVALIGAGIFLFSGQAPGALVGSAPISQPTASPIDQYESAIVQAKAAAEQNPDAASAWVDYGNMLYDSVQVVRELQPDSPVYQERLPRWLEATVAYSRALELEPDNASVRADLGVSACFYGAGVDDPQYLERGLAEVQQAASVLPEDPRVLLSLGHCYANAQPARTAEALETWLQVRESQPQESPFAQQAQILIQRYGGGGG